MNSNRRYNLKPNYDPCLIIGSDPHEYATNENLTDSKAEMMLAKGHGKHIFEINKFFNLDVKKQLEENADMQLFQICYDYKSQQVINPPFIAYDNSHNESVFFESIPMIDIVTNIATAKYVGVFSHRLYEKIPSYISYEFISETIKDKNYDIVTLFPHRENSNVLQLAESYHPNFIKTLEVIFNRIGVNFVAKPLRTQIHSNQFMARIEVYKAFVNEILAPAVCAMMNPLDKELQSLLWVESNYKPNYKDWQKNLTDKFGINYYPMHTFLIERMINIFIDKHNFNIKHLL